MIITTHIEKAENAKFNGLSNKLFKNLAVATIAVSGFFVMNSANAAPFVLAYTDGQIAQSYTNLQVYYQNLSAVGIGSTYSLTASGAISLEGMTDITANIISFSQSKALPIYPTVSDYSNSVGGFDPSVSRSILGNATIRATAVNNLVNIAKSKGFAGINLDLEAVQSADKANFSTFVASLGSTLRANGMKLIISVPSKVGDNAPDYLGGYDYAALGQSVDYFQVMTYDQVGPGWSSGGFNNERWPGPESGLDWQKAILSYTTSKITASKVLSGLPSYGYNYYTGSLVYWSDYGRTITNYRATSNIDVNSATPYASWGTVASMPDGTAWSTSTRQPVLWYDDAKSIIAKTSLVGTYKLGGTSVWAMGYEDANFWSALQSGLKNATTTPTPAIVMTSTAGIGGTVTPAGSMTVAKGSNQTYTISPNANYSISSVMVDGVSVGKPASYTFSNIAATHSISATFTSSSTPVGTGIGTLGQGYIWAKNTGALSNTNRVANTKVNSVTNTTDVNINPTGENGRANWEAAGIVWTSRKTVSSVTFINGAVDSYGNGYLQGNVGLQFTNDGVTWVTSDWKISPTYPNSSAASGATYTFSGTARTGVLGVRVVGTTGSSSWSWIVRRIEVAGS